MWEIKTRRNVLIVTWLEREVRRPLDDERDDPGREDDARRHPGLALLAQAVADAVNLELHAFLSCSLNQTKLHLGSLEINRTIDRK